MRLRAQEYFFARDAFCAGKLEFRENVKFHGKGGSGLKNHQFGAVIHMVSCILRFREFPSRKNHRIYVFTDFMGIP